MRVRPLIAAIALIGCLLSLQTAMAKTTMPPDGTQHVSREALANKLAGETKLPLADITALLEQATFRPEIIKLMNQPHESLPYAKYRPLFVTERTRSSGEAFMAAHAETFARMSERYHVDAAIIAAILGIETRFGEHKGNKPILDSLYTLSTGYPRRADFFRKQLVAIIAICRREHLDLATLKGSYAGAFGAIQFIPTSFRDFAIDGDDDGIRDVFDSEADIIGSIANYFEKHGWQQGRPVARWLPENATLTRTWRARDKHKLHTWTTLGELRKHMPRDLSGVGAPWREDDPVSLIEMETDKGRRYALVHRNFQVIMRYNASFNYAMAVNELAAMWEKELFAVN